MYRGRNGYQPRLRMATACCLLAVIALSLGPTGERVVRSTVRDAAAPGFAMRRILHQWESTLDFSRWPWSGDRRRVLASESDARENLQQRLLKHENQQLRARLALEQKKLAVFESSLGPVKISSPEKSLAVTRLPARVLAPSEGTIGPAGVVIDAGRAQGVDANTIAVSPLLLAAGTEDDVANGEVILAGASVVGRTEDVGAWTSTFLPVTDERFRAHVWIVRAVDEGGTFGEEGILEGDGKNGCRVKYVPSTTAVAVGDHVYSHDPSGRIPQPLYYGQIVRAELKTGAPHWDIDVRPEVDLKSVPVVHVLKTEEPSPPEFVVK